MRRTVFLVGLAIVLAGTSESYAQQRFAVADADVKVVSRGGGGRSLFLDAGSAGHAPRYIVLEKGTMEAVDGETVRRIPVEGSILTASASRTGAYVGVVLMGGGKEDGSGNLVFELLDTDLGARFRIQLAYSLDDPLPGFDIGEDGSVVLTFHADGRIEFYSATGNLLARRILTSGSHDIERTIVVSRAASSKRVAVAVNEPITDGRRSVATDRVRLFSSSGEEEGEFAVPSLTVAALELSPSGDVVAFGAYDVTSDVYRTTFFDLAGREVYTVDFAADRVTFDDSGLYALLAGKRRIAVVRPAAGESLLEYRTSESNRHIVGTAFSDDATFAVALSAKTHFEESGFVHDNIRVVEFVRAQGARFEQSSADVKNSAASAVVAVGQSGIAVALDGGVLFWERR